MTEAAPPDLTKVLEVIKIVGSEEQQIPQLEDQVVKLITKVIELNNARKSLKTNVKRLDRKINFYVNKTITLEPVAFRDASQGPASIEYSPLEYEQEILGPKKQLYLRFLNLLRESPGYLMESVRNNGVHFRELDRLCNAIIFSLYNSLTPQSEERRFLYFLYRVLKADFEASTDPINFLRCNSFASKLLQHYTQRAGGPQLLEETIKEPVARLLKCPPDALDVEIDPFVIYRQDRKSVV